MLNLLIQVKKRVIDRMVRISRELDSRSQPRSINIKEPLS